jgi:peroxiredoxin
LVGFFLFATLVASRQLPSAANAPKVGEKAPDFTLPDSQGRPVALHDLVGAQKQWVVLIFYRGYW